MAWTVVQLLTAFSAIRPRLSVLDHNATSSRVDEDVSVGVVKIERPKWSELTRHPLLLTSIMLLGEEVILLVTKTSPASYK